MEIFVQGGKVDYPCWRSLKINNYSSQINKPYNSSVLFMNMTVKLNTSNMLVYIKTYDKKNLIYKATNISQTSAEHREA